MSERPYQNRVDPSGQLHAVRARGTLFGNRGILHDEHRRIVSDWQYKAWLTCRLDEPGRRREIMAPGRYTELFFLDEATAFAAGHRPCWQCRRARLDEFRLYFDKANAHRLGTDHPRLAQVDEVLHADRWRKGGKVTFKATWRDLPSGCMVEIGDTPFLVWSGRLLRWTFDGYAPAGASPRRHLAATVLTPASVVGAFGAGLVPEVHPSAHEQAGTSPAVSLPTGQHSFDYR